MMFESFARVAPGPGWLVASVQGLNRSYTARTHAVVANWMTREDREFAIADNIAYVDTVCDQLEREFGSPSAIAFAGFSQGVAMAYRAARRGRRECTAILAVGGDVPPELKEPGARAWPHVLAATGERDGWYTPARLAEDMAFLRTVRPDAHPLVFDGGHEWAEPLVAAARPWLQAIAPGA
jgi:predicted esterase